MNEDCLFTVGELAKKCGVTVRTLQYYDQCGLLSPSRYSEGGRRLYSIDDVLRLQQILFFKGFGFTLEEIRNRLMTINSAQDFAKLLAKQKNVIEEQIRHLEKIVSLMDETIERIGPSENLSINMVMAILKAAKQNDFYSLVIDSIDKKYMDSFLLNEAKTDLKDWDSLLTRLKELHKKGADPFGQEAEKLAEDWWNRIMELTGGDPNLIATVFSAGESLPNWPEETDDIKTAIEKILSPALGSYLLKQGIVPPGMEDGFK